MLGLTLSNKAFSEKVHHPFYHDKALWECPFIFLFTEYTLLIQVKSAKRKRVENEQVVLDLNTFLEDVAAIGEGLVKSIYLSPARRRDM